MAKKSKKRGGSKKSAGQKPPTRAITTKAISKSDFDALVKIWKAQERSAKESNISSEVTKAVKSKGLNRAAWSIFKALDKLPTFDRLAAIFNVNVMARHRGWYDQQEMFPPNATDKLDAPKGEVVDLKAARGRKGKKNGNGEHASPGTPEGETDARPAFLREQEAESEAQKAAEDRGDEPVH